MAGEEDLGHDPNDIGKGHELRYAHLGHIKRATRQVAEVQCRRLELNVNCRWPILDDQTPLCLFVWLFFAYFGFVLLVLVYGNEPHAHVAKYTTHQHPNLQ